MRGWTRSALIALAVTQTPATALADQPTALTDKAAAANGVTNSRPRAIKDIRPTTLDRVAYAVDGAESSHGEDPGMWGLDPSGPQGPMQVTEAAAADVGGGDRFDVMQNRAIGRAYLALLYWRYKNWPDAIAAYNWGMGNVDVWIKAGRPPDKFLVGVAAYLRRVLHDSGMCADGVTIRQPRVAPAAEGGLEGAAFARIVCSDLDAWGGSPKGMDRHFLVAPSRFHNKLEKALLLAAEHLPASQQAAPSRKDRAAAGRTSGGRP